MTDAIARLIALGFPGVAEGVADGATVADLLRDLSACERIHDDNPDPRVYREARAILASLPR